MARSRLPPDYNINVFINCPFDSSYLPMFRGIIFTVVYCGFRCRCALEIDDSSKWRMDKIFQMMEQCRFGIHDISRTQLDTRHHLPRFNMPLELGMFLGAKRQAGQRQRGMSCLILDSVPFRYQKFISDIAGQDIRFHSRNVTKAVAVTRDWLRASSKQSLPGGSEITRHYARFTNELPRLLRKARILKRELTHNDYVNFVAEWLKADRAAQALTALR